MIKKNMLKKMILCLAFLGNSYVYAQNSFEFNRNQPIDITANSLSVDDGQSMGYFDGGVDVIQGKFHLRCDNLKIEYDNAGSDGNTVIGGKIKQMTASGHVLLTSGTENAKAEKMIYDVANKKITLSGNVLVSRQNSVLSGDVIDIMTESKQISVRSNSKKRIHSVIHLNELKND